MTLWGYLKSKMERYGERIAFANSGLTYRDLVNFSSSSDNESRLLICEGKSREEQAISILRCIAEGNVAVPITKEYGIKNYEYIHRIVKTDIAYETRKDLAFLMFTSGTTGVPKGVMLTHENIISNLQYIETYFNLSNVKSICVARPLVHIAVLTGEILYALCCGLTIYFYEESFMPQRLLSYFIQNEIDVFCATPTLYQSLSLVAKNKDIPIKIGVLSGEVLTDSVSKTLINAFPKTKFYNVYGLTEHSPRVSALLPDDFAKKPSSVGKAIGGVQLKIVDGELWVKSASVMRGYFLEEEKTQRKIKNGWLLTGDRAGFDDDGYLYIYGRKDGMLIKAGINVYPEEIENAVKEISGVTDCLVYGESSETGTVICMDYIGALGVKALRKLLVNILNPNIVPSKIRNVEALARTASGKKLRK